MARGAWSATGHAITESDLTEHTHAHTHTHTHTQGGHVGTGEESSTQNDWFPQREETWIHTSTEGR